MEEQKQLDIAKRMLEIVEQVKGVTELQGTQAKIFKTMADTDDRLVDIIAFMQKVISILIFTTILLVLRVFLWDATNFYLGIISNFWSNLSEGYRILILGLIGSIPAGIIATVVGHIINEKIKIIFKKDKSYIR